MAANILVVNNYRDADTDVAAGKRTLVVRFGKKFARWQFMLSHQLALAVPHVAAGAFRCGHGGSRPVVREARTDGASGRISSP